MCELFDAKEFYAVLARKQVVQKLSETAFDAEGSKASKNAALTVLKKLTLTFSERQKSGMGDNDSNHGNDEDDDIIIK